MAEYSKEVLEENFLILKELTKNTLLSWQNWHRLFDDIAENREWEGVKFAGLKFAPAGKGNHHAFPGGLIDHMIQMWDIYNKWQDCGLIKAEQPFCEVQRVLKIIILHDLHKGLFEFSYTDTDGDIAFDYGSHPYKHLMTNDVRSLHMAQQFGISLDALEMNALLNSEGGWSKNPPKYTSVLAKLVYLLDEMSSNVMSRIATETSLNVRIVDNLKTFNAINPFQAVSHVPLEG
jgi:hypothetical protein